MGADEIRCIVRSGDTRPSGLAVGLITLIWGLWLLLPSDTFAIIEPYKLLGLVMPEWAWGILYVAVGTAELYAQWRAKILVRMYAMFAMMVLWTIVSAAFWVTAWTGAAPITYTGLAVICAWCYLRLSQTIRIGKRIEKMQARMRERDLEREQGR